MKKTYTIVFDDDTKRDFKKIPRQQKMKILDKIAELEDDPRPKGCKKLEGEDNAWRIRIGDYRVIYTVEDEIVTVYIVKIGHRKDIYRKK